jgi:hypothetical protein
MQPVIVSDQIDGCDVAQFDRDQYSVSGMPRDVRSR